MRSASSTTVTSTRSRRQWRWRMRSSRRPRACDEHVRATTQRVHLGRWPAPPITVVTLSDSARASGVRASATWLASSRVGTSTSARGRDGSRRILEVARAASIGRPKAIVLPLPVRPRPRTSRPASESGNVALWIGKGVVMPLRSSAVTRGAGTPRSANPARVEVMKVRFLSGCGWPLMHGQSLRKAGTCA